MLKCIIIKYIIIGISNLKLNVTSTCRNMTMVAYLYDFYKSRFSFTEEAYLISFSTISVVNEMELYDNKNGVYYIKDINVEFNYASYILSTGFLTSSRRLGLVLAINDANYPGLGNLPLNRVNPGECQNHVIEIKSGTLTVGTKDNNDNINLRVF